MNRVLFISHEASISGAPLFLVKLLRHIKLERPSYKIAVFFTKNGELVELLTKEGFEVFVSEKRNKSNSYTAKLLSRLRHYLFYIRILYLFRPNLVYSNTIVNFGEVIIGRIFKAFVILHVHEGMDYFRKCSFRLNISCYFAGKIIAGSHYVQRNIKLITNQVSVVVHNGVMPQNKVFFKPMQSGAPFKIGVLGTIQLNKGQLVALEALNLLVKRGLKPQLLIAGKIADQSYYSQLVNYINSNSLGAFVDFVGIVPDSMVFINSLDLLLVPSFDEAFPTVILEAFSTKTLVIASNVGGIPEIIQHDVNGLLFSVGYSNELAEALERAVIDEKLFKRLTLIAFKMLDEKFNLYVSNKKITSFLDEILIN